MLRNNVVTVDLGKIRQNYLLQKSLLPRETEIMPVIKADAYGHGMVPAKFWCWVPPWKKRRRNASATT